MKLLFQAIFFLCFGFGFAQDCTITIFGVVHDFHEGTPLQDAQVYSPELKKSIRTNSDGTFSFTQVCTGKITFTVSHFDCEPVTKVYNITKDLFVDIDLEHHIDELEQVQIKGLKGHKEAVSNVEQTVDISQIQQSSITDFTQVLDRISGVNILSNGNGISKPIIHGLHSSRLAIINGTSRLQDQDWGHEHAPSLNIEGSQSITVVKGASTLEYAGDIVAGAILVKPKKAVQQDTLFGNFNATLRSNNRLFGNHLALSKGFKNNLYLHIDGGTNQAGDAKSPDYRLSNTGFKDYSFNVNLGQESFTKGWRVYYSYFRRNTGILAAGHIGNTTDLYFAIQRERPSIVDPFTYEIDLPNQDVTHHTIGTEAFIRFKGLGKLQLSYNFQENKRLEFDRGRAAFRDTPVVNLNLKTQQIRTSFEFDKSKHWKIKTGIQGQHQVNFPDPNIRVRRIIPDYTQLGVGAFTVAKYTFNNQLKGDLGVRYDYTNIDAQKFYRQADWDRRFADRFPQFFVSDEGTQVYTEPKFDFHNFSFHTGLWWEINENFDSRFSLGYSQRNPNPAELFSDGVNQSSLAFEIGDLGLEQEKSSKLITEFAWHKEKFDVTISPFVHYIQNFIYLNNEGTRRTIRGAFLNYDYKQNNAFLTGADLDLTYHFNTKWSTTHSLSYVYAENLDQDIPLVDTPSLNGKHNLVFYPNKKWEIGANLNWFTEQNRIPNNNFFITIEGAEREVNVSESPNAYALTGLFAQTSFNIYKHKLSLRLEAENLFNNRYRSYLNRLRFFADEPGRSINFKLNYNF